MRLLWLSVLLLAGACVATASPATPCARNGALERFVRSTYGERIEFDVLRNGKTVGQHVTSFETEADGIRTLSQMELKISVFFVSVYEFEYTSRSKWCDGFLRELESSVVDGGTIANTQVESTSNTLIIRHGKQRFEANPDLIPTDHWNPMVRSRREVLNTITGQVNNVRITPCLEGSAIIEAAAPGGRCYEYSGDLQTRVWYDGADRWVGLEFTARDGSLISYVCRKCARGRS